MDEAWNRRLLRVVYPFPYREIVVREAAEWGVDPFMLAALIRQESAFKADIRSGAGAVGLMQVMPPTGKELARAYGPDGFQEANLTTPEVNLHLGAAFFVEMNRALRRGSHAGPLRLQRGAHPCDAVAEVPGGRRSRAADGADPLRGDPRLREERAP